MFSHCKGYNGVYRRQGAILAGVGVPLSCVPVLSQVSYMMAQRAFSWRSEALWSNTALWGLQLGVVSSKSMMAQYSIVKPRSSTVSWNSSIVLAPQSAWHSIALPSHSLALCYTIDYCRVKVQHCDVIMEHWAVRHYPGGPWHLMECCCIPGVNWDDPGRHVKHLDAAV